ncbi:hypothetical protein C3L33_11925, partial [Rhododendron williamsianum]
MTHPSSSTLVLLVGGQSHPVVGIGDDNNWWSGISDSWSVGGLAGLAIAILFIWRLWRPRSGTQRRQPKRRAPTPGSSGASNRSDANLISSGLLLLCTYWFKLTVYSFLLQLTLGQVVRQKLSEGRKVTCRLLGVVLEETSPEELQVAKTKVTVRSSVLEVLLEITKFCDLYLMERVSDDESEKKVLSALEDAGLFTSGGLVKDKVLFCSTENGRTSFVRQLEPDWHIDTNPDIIFQLAVREDTGFSEVRSQGRELGVYGPFKI